MQHDTLIAEWGPAEYRALAVAVARGAGARGPALEALADEVRSLYGGRPVFLLNQGRLALEIALRVCAARAPGRTDVIVPAYICPSVVSAVARAGLEAVPVDVGADLNIHPADVARSITPRTLAVVAAHMYACPAAIGEIEEICRRAGVFLVDDAAQVIGVMADGRPLGCFGQFGIVSFSEVKSVTAGAINAGGLLVVNDDALEAEARRLCEALPEGEFHMRDFLIFLEDGPLYRPTAAARYYLGEVRRRLLGRTPPPRFCAPRRMANASAAIALCQLDSLAARRAGRARLAEAYSRVLTGESGIVMPQAAPGRYLTRMMALLPEGVPAVAVRERLAKEGIGTRTGYWLAERHHRAMVRSPGTGRRLLELPNGSRTSAAGVERICAALLRAVAAR